MATVDVIKCCLEYIRNISDDIKDAIVYLDAGTTESFQFLGAFSLFLELGAVTVCSLENMTALDKAVDWNTSVNPAQKILVMTSCFLSDAHRYTLRCLTTLQSVQRCAIYTAISEVAHSVYPDSPLGPDAYHEYESLLTQDYEELVKKNGTELIVPENSEIMESVASEDEGWSELTSIEDNFPGNDGVKSAKNQEERYSSQYSDDVGKKLMVSVHHFPLILCPFSPRVFVLPSEGSVAAANLSGEHENSISYGLPPLSTGAYADTEDVSPGVTLTAQFLYHLALKMDLKLEIFSLGDSSKNVGKLLTDMSSLYDVGRRKRTAGLLIIDRTLDLLTPCYHGDSLVDRIFSSLPRRQRHVSLNQTRSSQSQLKNQPVKLERPPVDVQIPLEKIINEEGTDSRVLEFIEAFLQGWNTGNSDAQITEFMKFSRRMDDKSFQHTEEGELFHGSFVSIDNFRGAPYLEALLERRTKDGSVLIKKWLQESLRRENISLNVKVRPGLASKSELLPLVRALARKQSSFVKNKGIIQLAAATVHASDEVHSARWDAFNSAEKILHASAGDTSQTLAAQITDIINKSAIVDSEVQWHNEKESSKGLFNLQDALLLTVVGYILAGENFPTSGSGGPFSWQEEHFMKEAIVDAILENPAIWKLKFLEGLSMDLEANLNKKRSGGKKEDSSDQLDTVDFDDEQWGSWGDDDLDKETNRDQVYDDMQLKLELRDRVDNFFKFLHKLSSMKRVAPLREGMLLSENQYDDNPYSSTGLLYKLLISILEKHDVPGLEYHSSTVGRLFKSGFGRFGLGQAKPSLVDQNVILIFVIGGINGLEVRELQEALTGSSRPDVEVILGGTTFLTPDDMRELFLGDYSCI